MKKYFWFLILIGLFACEEQTTWDLETTQSDKIVVEAILTDERKIHQIQLTKAYTDLNGQPEGIDDAIVSLSAGRNMVSFINDGNGVYESELQFRIVENLEYNFKIEWEGKEYTASSKLSEVAPISQMTFDTLKRDTNLRAIKTFASSFNPNQQAMYEVFIDWSHFTQNDSSRAKMIFYTFSNIDISQVRPPDAEVIPFPKGSRIKVRKFGLNDDYADFLRSIALETIWNGTFFYVTGDNLPTNISGGAHGFFSTCAVLEKNLIVE